MLLRTTSVRRPFERCIVLVGRRSSVASELQFGVGLYRIELRVGFETRIISAILSPYTVDSADPRFCSRCTLEQRPKDTRFPQVRNRRRSPERLASTLDSAPLGRVAHLAPAHHALFVALQTIVLLVRTSPPYPLTLPTVQINNRPCFGCCAKQP